MPSAQTRADGLAERISAAGFTPRVIDQGKHVCIETEVPEMVSATSWQDLLAVLQDADWFGLVDSTQRGRTAWAAVTENAPATHQDVRGLGFQL